MRARLDLTKRRCQVEIMDEPGLDADRHVHALRGLARINFWSGSAGILWHGLGELTHAGNTLRLLDVASGAGDVPIRLWHKARRAGVVLDVDGCDLSPLAVDFASRQAEACRADVRFFVWNALVDQLVSPYDVVTSSLFLHHLSEEQAITLLRRMAGMARRLVLVNDLRRGLPGFLLAYVGTRLLTTSPVLHTDGPRSVEAAFTLPEVNTLARQAGLEGAVVERRWPCRLLLKWQRGAVT